LENQGREREKAAGPRFLNVLVALPYHLRAGRHQRFGTGTFQCFEFETQGCTDPKPGPMAGGFI
jgi:hypothetical protein